MSLLTIGLMSGTSLDGVDGVLAEFADGRAPKVLAHVHRPFDDTLQHELLALCTSGADELHRAALAANTLMTAYAGVVAALLAAGGRDCSEVAVIGAHGQTVRHHPGAFDGQGYTLQLANGALLAERTGIDTVCDFRSADVAAGGQGAPLVPAFHAAVFAQRGRDVAVLNIGGISNLTLLPYSGAVSGFDCGPGNLLLDLWCQRHLSRPYDAGGAWASGGRVDEALLVRMASDPYFAWPPPKSTGRERFNAAWLDRELADCTVGAVDVMATLTELTALGAAEALQRHLPGCQELLVCGGGAFNGELMRRLQRRLAPACAVSDSGTAGVPPDQVEALAFAWLAARRLAHAPGNLPVVTGARGPRVLGAWYPAPR